MTIQRHTLYDEIDAEQARALWAVSGKDIRDAEGFAYKDGKSIAHYSVRLNRFNFDALIENADEILYWHYGFSPECGRELSIKVGSNSISVSVKCEYTLDRPAYSE